MMISMGMLTHKMFLVQFLTCSYSFSEDFHRMQDENKQGHIFNCVTYLALAGIFLMTPQA